MLGDCHIHMILDGVYYRSAIDRHRQGPVDSLIRPILSCYQKLGISFLRDGGDAWGVCSRAKVLAEQMGIDYRQPGFPIYKAGHYGSFLGRAYETLADYRRLLHQVRQSRGDFVKLMISGIMDFTTFGRLSCPGLPSQEIMELIHIAHQEGFAVMVHANGDETISAALGAGVDSVEHGAYMTPETRSQLAESGAIWVPTLATVGNLLGSGRYPDQVLRAILESQLEAVAQVSALGGHIALGSDAGAWRVPHGQGTLDEYALLRQAMGPGLDRHLQASQALMASRFQVCEKP